MSIDVIKFKPWKIDEVDIQNYKKLVVADWDNMSKENKDKLLYGEWKMEPVELLVLYSKGNKRSMQAIYGKDNVHYVNTKYSEVKDVIMGHRYKQVIVVDDGVGQDDVDIAERYRVEV